MTARDYFYDEVEKLADWRSMARRGLMQLATPGQGAAVGGLLGAAQGAYQAPPGSRTQGALSGALRGGAIGAGAGFLGRHAVDARLLHPELSAGQAAVEGLRGAGRSIKHFAKREIHGLTGAYGKDPTALGFMTPENLEKTKRLEHLRAAARAEGASPQRAAKVWDDAIESMKSHETEAAEFADRQAHGITSLPGTLRGLRHAPLETSKALVRATTGGSATGKALAAAPIAFAVPELLKGDERETGGPSMKRKVLATGANVAGNVLTGGMPVLSQALAGGALDVAFMPRRKPPRRIAPAASASAVDSAEGTP